MMPTFAYDGVDRKGIKVKGELTAKNMALAKVTLRKQGITIKTIREKRRNILEGLMKKRVSTLDITIFTRQLATMMKAGVPLVQGFEIVAEGLENPAMREVVLGIKAEVEGAIHLPVHCVNIPNILITYSAHWSNLVNSLVHLRPCSTGWPSIKKRVNFSSRKLKGDEISRHSYCGCGDCNDYSDG